MSGIVVAVAVTVVVGVALWLAWHLWRGRADRGGHSRYDENYSVEKLIAEVESEIELEAGEYRKLKERLRSHRQNRERVGPENERRCSVQPCLLAGTEAALLCGTAESAQSVSDWPTQRIT
jgi:hypothetical protein